MPGSWYLPLTTRCPWPASGVPPAVMPVQVPCGAGVVNALTGLTPNASDFPRAGTVPFGYSWPYDISWNRLNVDPGLAGSLIALESASALLGLSPPVGAGLAGV